MFWSHVRITCSFLKHLVQVKWLLQASTGSRTSAAHGRCTSKGRTGWDFYETKQRQKQSWIGVWFNRSFMLAIIFLLNQSMIIRTKFKFIHIQSSKCWFPVFPTSFWTDQSWNSHPGRTVLHPSAEGSQWAYLEIHHRGHLPGLNRNHTTEPLKQTLTYHPVRKTFLLKWLIFVGFCWGIFYKHAQHAMKVVIHSASDLLVKQDWHLY